MFEVKGADNNHTRVQFNVKLFQIKSKVAAPLEVRNSLIMNMPIIAAVVDQSNSSIWGMFFFGFLRIILLKNLVSREPLKNSQKFSLLDLSLEAFWFHFSLLEKEWKHFLFTLHFSKKSNGSFFSLCTSRKTVKAFIFHFSLLELPRPTLAGAWLEQLSSSPSYHQ